MASTSTASKKPTTASKVGAAYARARTAAETVEEEPTKRVQRERQRVAVVNVSAKTPESVVKALSQTKIQVTEAFDTIANRVVSELGSLKEIQTAIEAEQENLANLHSITAEANSLQALLNSQQEQREAFAREATEQRARWDAEKTQVATERKRDTEQYDYDTRKRRQADRDTWQAELAQERAAFAAECQLRTNELDARQETITDSEGELKSLREAVAKAEETTKADVAKAVAVATNSLKKDLTHEHTLKTLELQNTLNLKNSEINQLQARVIELAKANQELDINYKEATQRVQAIAEKAIEGASAQKVVVQNSTTDTSEAKRR